jgi:hypothetical protein
VKRPKKASTSGKKVAASKGQAETKVNKTEPRSEKVKGATTQGGTGEEGLESTVCLLRSRLDCLLIGPFGVPCAASDEFGWVSEA